MRSSPVSCAAALGLLLAAGCTGGRSAERAAEESRDSNHPWAAAAELSPSPGSTVRGTVTLTRDQGGVRIVAHVEGLAPGRHAFFILDSGSCSAADSGRTPAHFNPTGQPHGDVDSGKRHLGDLGNLVADRSGNAHYDRLDRSLTLEGPEAIVGHALVVQARADDPAAQPDGGAGPSIACAVITVRRGQP